LREYHLLLGLKETPRKEKGGVPKKEGRSKYFTKEKYWGLHGGKTKMGRTIRKNKKVDYLIKTKGDF